jgi:hypothetical protein
MGRLVRVSPLTSGIGPASQPGRCRVWGDIALSPRPDRSASPLICPRPAFRAPRLDGSNEPARRLASEANSGSGGVPCPRKLGYTDGTDRFSRPNGRGRCFDALSRSSQGTIARLTRVSHPAFPRGEEAGCPAPGRPGPRSTPPPDKDRSPRCIPSGGLVGVSAHRGPCSPVGAG